MIIVFSFIATLSVTLGISLPITLRRSTIFLPTSTISATTLITITTTTTCQRSYTKLSDTTYADAAADEFIPSPADCLPRCNALPICEAYVITNAPDCQIFYKNTIAKFPGFTQTNGYTLFIKNC